MAYYPISKSKKRITLGFTENLLKGNHIKKNQIKKDNFKVLFKEYCNSKNVKLSAYWLLQTLLYLNFVKNWNKDHILFNLESLKQIQINKDSSPISKKHKKIQNIKNGLENSTSNKENENINQQIDTKVIQKANTTKQPPNEIINPSSKPVPNKPNSKNIQNLNTKQVSNKIKQNASKNKQNDSINNNLKTESANKNKNKNKKRRKKKKQKLVNQNVSMPSKLIETKYISNQKCDLCSCVFQESELSEHINSPAHKLRQKYRTNKRELIKHNMDVTIESEASNEGANELEVTCGANSSEQILLCIKNKSNFLYEISDILLLYTKLNDISLVYKLPIVIGQKSSQSIIIKFCFQDIGAYILPIVFKTENKKTNMTSYILKEVTFYIQSESDLIQGLNTSVAYKRTSKAVVELEVLDIIDGVRPPANSDVGLQLVTRLDFYDLPQYIIKLLNYGLKINDRIKGREKEKLLKLMSLLNVKDHANCLTPLNYCKMLKNLLYFEEHQMQINIRDFDCDKQVLHKVPGKPYLLELQVPGLAEDRPSLIKGDNLIVTIPGDTVRYKGYIHQVRETAVQLGFHKDFVSRVHQSINRYSVSFGFNRHTLRTEHQAVRLIKEHKVQKHFFPKTPSNTRQLVDLQYRWYQSKIQDNEQQVQAVKHIVSGTSYPAPYLLFGPPGTGKTMTVVEAILQLWAKRPNCRILVAAPSNSAANEVTSRLVKFIPKTDLFRIISVSFEYNKVHEDIRPYCNRRDGEYYYPDIEVLESFRILIVTLTAAAKLVNGGVTPGHFSYVFIDESGHSTESEVLIPIAGIITAESKPGVLLGQVVLAGDPKQLGPIIHSKLAKRYGFGTSMLERLMTHSDVYKKNHNEKYNPVMVTKLLKNFRSHEAILKLPDEMFYDNELQPMGNELTNIALGWNELPNKNFPLIFHNVKGQDQREPNSPSYFNMQEVEVVMKYLGNLVGKRLKGRQIQQADIGIVSPYRKQVIKLQIECKKRNWHNILIGSVEQFQGQERLIIITSTVRSTQNLVAHDYQFHLGFLKNPKRFNVAITRAKALVIVVGNPDILQWDQHWGRFIEYCKENGGLAGPAFDFNQSWLHNNNNNYSQMIVDDRLREAENELNEHSNFSRGNN